MSAANGSAMPSGVSEITDKGKGKAVDHPPPQDMSMDEDEDEDEEEDNVVCRSTLTWKILRSTLTDIALTARG
jgi:hypothetical protein